MLEKGVVKSKPVRDSQVSRLFILPTIKYHEIPVNLNLFSSSEYTLLNQLPPHHQEVSFNDPIHLDYSSLSNPIHFS